MNPTAAHEIVEQACLRVNALEVRSTQVGLVPGKSLVSDASFEVYPGKVTALVGESGSGKSLTTLSIAGLLPVGLVCAAQRLELQPLDVQGAVDLRSLSESQWDALRGKEIGYAFQDASAALNPVFRIESHFREAFRGLKLSKAQMRERSASLLSDVGIVDPLGTLQAYSFELSGGMKQRVMIALAIAKEPSLLIADEPTSALDATVQAQVVDVLKRLIASRNMGVLFVTHDLALVSSFADFIAVMRAGRVVEFGARTQVLTAPRDEYTRTLIEIARARSHAVVKSRSSQPASVQAELELREASHESRLES